MFKKKQKPMAIRFYKHTGEDLERIKTRAFLIGVLVGVALISAVLYVAVDLG